MNWVEVIPTIICYNSNETFKYKLYNLYKFLKTKQIKNMGGKKMYNQPTMGYRTNSDTPLGRRGSLQVGSPPEILQKPEAEGMKSSIDDVANTQHSKRRGTITRKYYVYVAMEKAQPPGADRRALMGLPNGGD